MLGGGPQAMSMCIVEGRQQRRWPRAAATLRAHGSCGRSLRCSSSTIHTGIAFVVAPCARLTSTARSGSSLAPERCASIPMRATLCTFTTGSLGREPGVRVGHDRNGAEHPLLVEVSGDAERRATEAHLAVEVEAERAKQGEVGREHHARLALAAPEDVGDDPVPLLDPFGRDLRTGQLALQERALHLAV